MFILEIRAEGLPSRVGPFTSQPLADAWAADHVRDGSWSVIPVMDPEDAA
jgi:hypothetical protein